MPSTTFFARTIRGIEWVAAAEVSAVLGATVERVGHREVWFSVAHPAESPLRLRTVDDVFFRIGTVGGLDHTRASLATLTAELGRLDCSEELRAAAELAGTERRTAFDVVASFLGRRNYNRTDIEDSAGSAIAETTGWRYVSRRNSERPDTQWTWRVHVVDDAAIIGLRVGSEPLHRRSYKRASLVGTLHPPLAAAMTLIAGLRPGYTLLDPCCGAGTIPIEASLLVAASCAAIGADLDPAAVDLARENVRASGAAGVSLAVGDAGRLPIGAGRVDRIVTNPPWGRSVDPAGRMERAENLFWRHVASALAPGGRVVALIEEPDPRVPLWREAGLEPVLRVPVSVSGSHPTIVVLGDAGLDRHGRYGDTLAESFRRWS